MEAKETTLSILIVTLSMLMAARITMISIYYHKKHTIYGGAGNDTIDSNSSEPLLIYGGADKDSITLTGVTEENKIHTIDGGAGNDIITGTSGKNLLEGGVVDDGDDTIISLGGNDTINGGAGNDLIQLTSDGAVYIHAGDGGDILEVGLNQLTHLDIIKGGAGEDIFAIVGTAADFNMGAKYNRSKSFRLNFRI